MRVALVYDLRDDYRALGFSEEEVAEFDTVETIDQLAAALERLGCEPVRVGRHAGQIRLEVPDELDPGHGALGPLEVHRLLDQRVQVDRLLEVLGGVASRPIGGVEKAMLQV